MSYREEIKIYNSTEELAQDYNNFREQWDYDRDCELGIHDSGLWFKRVMADGRFKLKVTEHERWVENLRQDGLNDLEIDDYYRMLKNQFITIVEKEPFDGRPKSPEERIEILKEIDERRIKQIKKDGASEKEIKEMEADLKAHREKLYREWSKGR